MADVTISQLTQGIPTGNALLPYSTGSNTLGVTVSSIFASTQSIGIGTGTNIPAGVLDLGASTGGRAIAWGSTKFNYANIYTSYSAGALVLGTNTLGGTTSLTQDKYYSSYDNASTPSSARRNIIRLNTFNDDGIQFFTNPGQVLDRGVEFTPLERMRINSAGNVGIGTTTPGATLDVNGSFKASQLAETGSWTAVDSSGANLTLVQNYGYYTKIGKLVYISWMIEYPANSNTSLTKISGLPFKPSQGYFGHTSITNFGSSNILSMVSREFSNTITNGCIQFRNYSNGTYANADMSSKFHYGTATYPID